MSADESAAPNPGEHGGLNDPSDLGDLVAEWPGTHALAIASDTELLGSTGDLDQPFPIASVTKLFTAWAALLAVEEGTLALDQPAGPPGSTIHHLLAHTSGLAFDGDRVLAAPGTRRIYSNRGIEVLADALAAGAAMDFADYLRLGVLEPLGLDHLQLTGSPAHGLVASANDLLTFGREVLSPKLLAPATVLEATSPAWPALSGVLPGFGGHDPNPWGLGFEIRGTKQPHWTGTNHHPSTFGHFGGAGSFLWIEPRRRLIGVTVGDVPFDRWAAEAWSATNDDLLRRFGGLA